MKIYVLRETPFSENVLIEDDVKAIYNILVTREDAEFEAWKKAHNLFVGIIALHDVFKCAKNKPFRVAVFQACRIISV